MLVNVIQFKRPDGRQISGQGEINEAYRKKHEDMTERGCRFTAEVVGDSLSLCIEHPEIGDFDIELIENDPGSMNIGLEQLMDRYSGSEFVRWKRSQR